VNLRDLLRYARPYRGQLAIVACLMLGEAGATLAVPWLAGQLAGGLLEGGGVPLGWLALVLVVVLALIGIIRFAAALISGTISTRILADLRLLAHDHLQALPLSFHQARQPGDLLAVTTWETGRLSDFLISAPHCSAMSSRRCPNPERPRRSGSTGPGVRSVLRMCILPTRIVLPHCMELT